MSNYIYLLQVKELLGTNIYKIGRTTQEYNKRFNQYPKGSQLILQMKCMNCINSEKELLKIFQEKFKRKKEYGNEYFEGNYEEMIQIIFSHLFPKKEIDCDFPVLQSIKLY